MATLPKKSKLAYRTGWIISILVILFLLMDAIMKIIQHEIAVAGTVELGYQASIVFTLGLILLICTLLYTIPYTSFLGAILLTGYLGGAVATHVQVGNPMFSHILFPVYMGILAWFGLYLRDDRLKNIVSQTKSY